MAYRILIVDDSSITRAVLIKTIGMTGVAVEQIHQASNGQEALALLAKERVDLILADLNMPQMNGREMAAKIREKEQTRHIPIVAISTEASATRIEELKAQGVEKYVHKPFTPEGIRQVLRDVLQGCPA